MPTVEATLQTTLGALCSGRCYPLVNNSATITYPYITFQVVSETTLTVTSDAKEAKRIQVDIFDRTYAGAKALAASAKTAVQSISGVASAFIVGFDGFEENTKDYRVIMEYYLWP